VEYEYVPNPEELHPNQLTRRNRIIETTIDLLEKKDYDDIMITTIAKKSKVALGTVYRYFLSKEQLFGEAYLVWQGRRYESLEARKVRITSEESYLRKIFVESYNQLQLHRNMTRILFILESSSEPNIANLDADIERKMLGVLSPVFTNSPSKIQMDIFRTLAHSLYVNTKQANRGLITAEEGRRRLNATIDLIYKGIPSGLNTRSNGKRKA